MEFLLILFVMKLKILIPTASRDRFTGNGTRRRRVRGQDLVTSLLS